MLLRFDVTVTDRSLVSVLPLPRVRLADIAQGRVEPTYYSSSAEPRKKAKWANEWVGLGSSVGGGGCQTPIA